MSPENKAKAIDLITNSNQAQAIFNVPVTDSYSNVHDIVVKNCNANLINKLIKAGFSLSMNSKGLIVDKYI